MHIVRTARILTLVATFFCSSLPAYSGVSWGNPAVAQNGPDPIAVCSSIIVGVAGPAEHLYYKGYLFTGVSQINANNVVCRDSNGNTFPLDKSCVDSGGNSQSCSMPTTPNMCSGSPMSVGDPIELATGTQIETALDWISLKDSRFKFERHYRSDTSIISTGGDADVLMFGGNWRHNFVETLQRAYEPQPDTYTLHEYQGNRLAMSGVNPGTPAHTGFEAEITTTGGNGYDPYYYTWGDGTGKKRTFRYRGGTTYIPTKIEWNDGYEITYDSATPRTEFVRDNRGQYADYTWSNTVVPGSAKYVVTQIDIDTDYDDITLQPEIRLFYTYAPNTLEPNRPLLIKVEREDIAAGATSVIYEYTYLEEDGKTTNPPLLTSIKDGRLDGNGHSFEYATFQYKNYSDPSNEGGFGHFSTSPAGSLTGTTNYWPTVKASHFGGADAWARKIDPSTGKFTSENTYINPLGMEFTFPQVAAGEHSKTSATSVAGDALVTAVSTLYNYTPNAGAPNGYVYGKTERNGSTTTFERDASGRVTLMTEDALGASPRVTSYTWHGDTKKVLTKTAAGLKEIYTYDASDKITSFSQEDVLASSPDFGKARTWSYSYTTLASGLDVLASIDGPGLVADGVTDITTYTYNADGTVADITDANGLVTTLANYNALGLPQLVTEPNGFEWAVVYDIMGRAVSVTRYPNTSYPQTATFDYDVIGQLTSYTDFDGGTWTYVYNKARRLVSEVNPNGDTIAYVHDAMGNVTRTEYSDGTNPATFWEDSEYDALGRLIKTLGAQGQIWNLAHDVEDRIASVEDPDGYTETYNRDPLKRVSDVVDRQGGTTIYGHNDADRPVAFTDQKSLTTTFVYNGFGEVVSEVSLDRGTTAYTYNNRGLLASKTDGANRTTTYSYDDGDRLVLEGNSANGVSNVVYTYDVNYIGNGAHQNAGHLGRVVDDVSLTNVKLQSHADGEYLSIRQRYLNSTWHNTYVWSRLDGQTSSLTYPNALGQLKYTYDASGRVIKLALKKKINGKWVRRTIIDNVTYAPSGPVLSMTYGDGATHTRSYDNSYRLTGLSDSNGTALRDVTMAYDARDNLSMVTDNLGVAGTELFDYTPREMLQTASGDYGSLGFGYDAVGNRTYRSVSDGTSITTDNYNYAPNSNQLSSITLGAGGTRTFTHDAAGNITYDNRSGGGYGYTYDGLGRLESFSINGVVQAEYKYNHLRQQAIRTLTQTGQTIDSVYGPDGVRIAEIDHATNTAIRGYIWFDGAPVAVIEGDDLYFVRSDHIARPVFATDEAGTKVWSAAWLPFGGVHVENGVIDARFPGQWFQAESGLHQNWMRDYDPTTGRYIQADPLGLVDGPSVYNYALQNPGRFVDPRGEQVTIICRPLAGLGVATLMRHCAIIVETEGDACIAAGTHQFSLGKPDTAFNQTPEVYDTDTNAWNERDNPFDDVSTYPISPPQGRSDVEFDYDVVQSATGYRADRYSNPYGPNSNTAAVQSVIDAGGSVPAIPRAPGSAYGR
jgi:RHS repeat-associated protein